MQNISISLIVFLFGLALLVYGYRIFLVLLPVWGFFAGFWLGADITALALGSGFLGTTAGWVIGFGLGIILSVFCYLYFRAAVAFQASIIAYNIGSAFVAAFFGPGTISALSGAMLAVIVLIVALALNLQKYIVFAVTSVLGSNMVLVSALLLFGRITLQSLRASGSSILPVLNDSWFWSLVWLVLTVAGVWGQIRANWLYEFRRETYQEGWG